MWYSVEKLPPNHQEASLKCRGLFPFLPGPLDHQGRSPSRCIFSRSPHDSDTHTCPVLPVTALKLAPESSEELTDTPCWCSGPRWGPGFCFSDKQSGGAQAAGMENTLRGIALEYGVGRTWVLAEYVLHVKKDNWNYVCTQNQFYLFLLWMLFKGCL